jgi:hypothetical protein
MNRLALRLLRAGGARPALLLVSSAVGMLLLLAALATPRAHDHQVWLQAARSDPAPYTGTAPHLLWQFDDRLPIAGKQLMRAAVAATGPGAPAPLGAPRVPRPGEIFVSAALAQALAGPDGAVLREALPGRVTGRLSNAIVSAPNELIYMVGYRASQLALPGNPFSRPRPVLRLVPRESAAESAGTDGFIFTLGFAVLIAAALVTIALMIANASRIGTRRREARLSALRLAGADSRQIARLIATEAAITALPGALLGALIARELRAQVQSWPFGIWPVLSRDLTLPTWELLLAIATVPAVAFASALLAVRGGAGAPLTGRHRTSSAPHARSLLVPLAGWSLLALAALGGDRLTNQGKELVAIVGASVAAAGVAMSGPWIASRCADLARRLARGPAVLLGARQLRAHPRAGFRAVSSLVLGLFVVSLSLTYFESRVPFSVEPAKPVPTARQELAVAIYSTYAPRIVDRQLAQTVGAIEGVRSAQLRGAAGSSSRMLLVTTNGSASTISRVAGAAEHASPALTISADGYYPPTEDDPAQVKRTLLDDAQSLLWILDALAAASLAVAAIDGIGDRRRMFSSLTAVGVPASTLRRAVAIEVLVPFAIAAITAVAFGVVVGATLVGLTAHLSASVPWSTLLRWLGIAAVAAIVATLATATRVNAAIRPEHLRSE